MNRKQRWSWSHAMKRASEPELHLYLNKSSRAGARFMKRKAVHRWSSVIFTTALQP